MHRAQTSDPKYSAGKRLHAYKALTYLAKVIICSLLSCKVSAM